MFRSRKRFGQHFLEPQWADKVIAAIGPEPSDRFLEIGPGPGALTLRLAPRVAHVTAVEVDRDVAAALAPQLSPNVTLVVADFLELDLGPLLAAGPLRVAGNLPYNISSPILFRLVEAARRSLATAAPEAAAPGAASRHGPLRDATVMVQREVADRIVASPGSGDYGVLSISVQLYAEARRVLALPPGAFRPPPKVHSAVVRLTFRLPPFALADEAVFGGMVRSMFTQRRKTIGNALGPFAAGRGADAKQVLAEAGLDPSRRAETLQLAELARLADTFSGRGS